MAAPSAQARRTLQDAFERFASAVTPDDRRLFHNTQLEDVRDEAMRIERQLRARRMQKNMARLDPFLRGMEHYSKVVEVLCNGTPYLAWIWAPVKLMLMITVDSISAFEKLIEAYGRIADMLPRLDRLGNALASDHNFQNVLALVYSDIVEFHRRAYKFVRRKSWAIFFSSMWAGFESRFNGILENLAYHSKLADKEAAAADIAEAIRRSKADDEQWEQQEREWAATKVQRVLTWLGANDTLPADILERHIRGCLPGSCDWFVQHKATQLWLRDSAKNPLLWLCGKPGAGKSMICSSLVQHAEANALHVFYYFCSYLGSHSDGPNRLLQSIISQVIQKHQDLAIYVHDVYFKSNPVPTKRALLSLLPELLRGLGSVRLVVDGVDEWAPRDQKELLRDLSQMISTDQSSHICKIMIASQDTMDISRSLRRKDKSAATISLNNGDERLAVNSSIANFVDSKLSDLPDHLDELDPSASILNHIKRTLLDKSHGMFLWVSLVLESLNTVYSPEELRTIVDDLPSDLEDLYERILVRLCSAPGAQSHGGVSRIMSWICFAQRPLHRSELLHALSILPHDKDAQVRSIPVASILDHCKPLIEELPDSTIVPVHFSVKRYFLKSRIPQIVPAIDAALDISSACAIAIARGLDLIHVEHSSNDYLFQTASGKYRLLPYALEFWIEHCLQYASGGGSLSPDQPIQHHLAKMHEKHTDCLHALGHAVIQLGTPDPNDTNHIDKRLQPFSNMSVYGLMVDVLNLRRLASQLDGDKSSDIETYIASNDPTLFSKLAHRYESAVVHLLGQHEINGIPSAMLRAFQDSYALTAFRCRFPHCNRLSSGFATAELRLEHETVHIQRVYCQTASCQYSRIGFARRNALNSHTRKYHDQSNILRIPAQVRRTTGARAETGMTSHESPNVDTEPQQPSPQQLAAGHSPFRVNPQQGQLTIDQFAMRLMDTCNEEVRAKFEAEVRAWPEDEKQQLLSYGIDPLFLRFRQHAKMLYDRGNLDSLAATQNAAGEETTSMQDNPEQDSMQGQGENINQRELNRELDFAEIARRQMEAIRSQDQGATVVPASNNLNNSGQTVRSQGQDTQSRQNLPSSPMPEGIMGQHRASTPPNLNFDPSLAPPGMPQNGPMGMRPQSSHPQPPDFVGQQATPAQMEAMPYGQLEQNQWHVLAQQAAAQAQQAAAWAREAQNSSSAMRASEALNKKTLLKARQEQDNIQEQPSQPEDPVKPLGSREAYELQLQLLEAQNKRQLIAPRSNVLVRQEQDNAQEQPSQPEDPLKSFDREEHGHNLRALKAQRITLRQAQQAAALARHGQDNVPKNAFNQRSPYRFDVPGQTRSTTNTEAVTLQKPEDFDLFFNSPPNLELAWTSDIDSFFSSNDDVLHD